MAFSVVVALLPLLLPPLLQCCRVLLFLLLFFFSLSSCYLQPMPLYSDLHCPQKHITPLRKAPIRHSQDLCPEKVYILAVHVCGEMLTEAVLLI